MAEPTPYQLVAQLERSVGILLADLAIDDMPQSEKNLLKKLKASLADVRLDIRDYDLAETRPEQIVLASEIKTRVDSICKMILLLSTYNVFSAIDVAHMTAKLGYLSDHLS